MKKLFVIAMVAVATVLAVGCTKEKVEDEKLKLPGTSWNLNLDVSMQGVPMSVNDTLDIIDNENLSRSFYVVAGGRTMSASKVDFKYTWNDTVLTLIKSDGEPSNLVLTYRKSDNVFFRDPGDDAEMSQMFEMLGIKELVYKQIK